jgi:hypothetical protein
MRPAVILFMTGLAGCVTRTLPRTFPPASAAAPTAPGAPVPAVTTALDSDPPPPGEETGAWADLAAAEAPGAPAGTAATSTAPAPATGEGTAHHAR